MVREFQAETVAMKIENNTNLIDMAVKHQTLKISNSSALVDKNSTINPVERDSRETVEREAKLTKDVRVAMKNYNYNEKLAEERKNK